MKEICGIPTCPTIKVKMDTEGKWITSVGEDKLPFICQSGMLCNTLNLVYVDVC